jgi:hypothetical protein
MPAKLKIEHECSRCPRVDTREMTYKEVVELGEKGLRTGPKALRAVVNGEEFLTFDHLCEECSVIVSRYLGLIGKKLEKVSSVRERTAEVEAEIEVEVNEEEAA